MGTELVALSSKELNAMVLALPTEKRAAWSKAAKAICANHRDSKKKYSKIYPVASAMMLNWWCMGAELPKLIYHGNDKKRNTQGDFTLDKLGVTANQSSRCQKLAKKSKVELDELLEANYDEQTYWLPSLRSMSEAHVSHNTGQPEWYTPPEYIEAARKTLGKIDLDPASSDKAQKVVNATKYYTIKDDGLSHDWSGCVWLNPPYTSGIVDDFMRKLADTFRSGNISSAITLTNNCTDTEWFSYASDYASAICLVAGRIKFLDESGDPGAPLQGQAILYFGKARVRFSDSFKKFGCIWTR